MGSWKDYCPANAVLYYITSAFISILLLFVTRYAQGEIHRQGGDLYESFFCLTTVEQVVPEIFFEEKEHVTLFCYENGNPMDYILISGDETLAALEENYETVKRGGGKVSDDTIFWAVSDRKKALENAILDWKNELGKKGKSFRLCEDRRITAAGLLGSKGYVYLLYGISWIGLLVFQIGNLMIYMKEKKKTARVYFLLGISGYVSMLKRNQILIYFLLCLGELVFLKKYCLVEAVLMRVLFYLLVVLWLVIYLRWYIEKPYGKEMGKNRGKDKEYGKVSCRNSIFYEKK